jgi:hypothetical protein
MSDQRPAEPATAKAVLRVYHHPDGNWRWCYQEPDSGLELHSNDDFSTREEAAASARRAYPDLAVVPQGRAAAVERLTPAAPHGSRSVPESAGQPRRPWWLRWASAVAKLAGRLSR